MVQQLNYDDLEVFVLKDRDVLGKIAGAAIADEIKAVLARKPTANIIFAAAPSQNETLATLLQASGIDWQRVEAFHMDEYIGLPEDHPALFRNFLKSALFDQLPFKDIHLIDVNRPPNEACLDYEKLLKIKPIDIVVLGVGENGHIAFNDPPVADFADPETVKVVELDEVCRQQQVNDGAFPGLDQVPKQAITLTIPTLLSATTLFCVAPGKMKANAIERMLKKQVSTNCPASILRKHGKAYLFLDRDSANKIC